MDVALLRFYLFVLIKVLENKSQGKAAGLGDAKSCGREAALRHGRDAASAKAEEQSTGEPLQFGVGKLWALTRMVL